MGATEPVSAIDERFEAFAVEAGPRLRRALVARFGVDDGCDVAAEALSYAWEHWERVRAMDNPVGYLYRRGDDRRRKRRRWRRPAPFPPEPPHELATPTDPELGRCLTALNSAQRTCVVLVHVYGWSYAEVGAVIDAPVSSVRNHVHRGLRSLRRSAGGNMSLDLEERLAAYRPTLEAAIDEWSPGGDRRRPARPSDRFAWMAVAVVIVAIAVGILGLVAVRTLQSDPAPLSDGPPPGPLPGAEQASDLIATTAPVATTPATVPAGPAPSASTATPGGFPAGPIYAIGDSVMLGAAQQLTDRGIVVSAEESRQISDTVPYMEQMGAAGQFGDAVVVHLGTNGPPSDEMLDAFLTPLADVPEVVLLTTYVDRSWTAETNLRLHAAAARFPNVEILDWATLAAQCPGECFWDDGYHLRPDGREYYVDLIVAALAD